MDLSKSLLSFVKGQEGYSSKPYWDYKQWTSGYGTRAKPGEIIDKSEAENRLSSELSKARSAVTSRWPSLQANQADALASFTYNLGTDWMGNGSNLAAAIDRGDYQGAHRVMQQYNKAGGAVLPALQRRRNLEGQMFLGAGLPSSVEPADVTPSTSQPSMASTLSSGANTMNSGRYVPENVINQRYRQADQLWGQNWSPTLDGALAAGLGGFGSGMLRNKSRDDLVSNQGMRTADIQGAMANPTMAAALLGKSQVPELQELGLKQTIADQDRVNEQNDPMYKAKLEALQLETQRAKELAESQKAFFDQFGESAAPSAPSAPTPPQPAGGAAPSLTKQTIRDLYSTLSPEKKALADAAIAQRDIKGLISVLTPDVSSATDEQKEYELAKRQGYAGTFMDYKQAIKGQAEGPQLKEYQTKDAMWADRLNRTNGIIDKVATIDPTTGVPAKDAYNPAKNSNKFWPDDMFGANLFNSSEWQQYQQAAREGIAAILRKDTGAAVTETEWNLYFPMLYPQPGDDPAVVLQKQKARQAAAAALKASSGPAFDVMFPQIEGGAPPAPPAPAAPQAPTATTFDDESQIPEGAKVRDETTGKIMIMKGGQLIPFKPPMFYPRGSPVAR